MMAHVIKINNDIFRVVRGKLVDELILDWSIKDLGAFKRHISFDLDFKDDYHL
jgi:hypothetical protein